MEEIRDAYVTKYALTSGVFKIDGEFIEGNPLNMLRTTNRGWFFRDEWHRDEASAAAQFELMRQKKIAALEKQIKRLEAKSFAVREKI